MGYMRKLFSFDKIKLNKIKNKKSAWLFLQTCGETKSTIFSIPTPIM